MPRALLCSACQRRAVIRDDVIGRPILCHCGQVLTVSDNAPGAAAPTTWLDSWALVAASAALLLVSLLAGSGVTLWVVLDQGAAGNDTMAAVSERSPALPDKSLEALTAKASEKLDPSGPIGKGGAEGSVTRAPAGGGPRLFTEKELHKRLLQSVVLIYHSDGKVRYTGSGSVIHRGRRLIITNQHVVQKILFDGRGKPVGHEEVARVGVLFPQVGDGGKPITDKKYYESKMERKEGVMARVLPGTSEDPDLALIELEGDMPQTTIALKVAPEPAGAGEKVLLVGNSGLSSGSFGMAAGLVKNRLPRVANWKSTRCLETHIPSFGGDSGSAVVNYHGHIVGVHFGAKTVADKGASIQYAVDRDEVLKFLQNYGMERKEVEADDALPPPSTVVVDLIKQLDDPDEQRCDKAVEALSRVDPTDARRAIPALVRALQRHPEGGFRRRATEELQRIGPPVREDVACLDPAMRIAYKPLRLYVLQSISQLGSDAREGLAALVVGLKDTDSEVRQKSALVVKSFGARARSVAFAPLLKLANDSDEEVARAGLDALRELGSSPEEIDALAAALAESKGRLKVRQHAAEQLGLHGDKAARTVPTLAKVLQTEKDSTLLSLVIATLRHIGDKQPAACAALVSVILTRTEEKLRLEALEALDALDLSAFSTGQMLDCCATDKSPLMREAISKRLGTRLGALKADQMKEFIPLLRHPEPSIVRVGLGAILMKKRDAASLAVELVALVTHEDDTIRGLALAALQGMGPSGKAAVPLLVDKLKTVPEGQRLVLAITIGTIEPRDPKVIEVVLPRLIAGLHPRTRKPGAPTVLQIRAVLTPIGQPAVDAIFKYFETIPYRGKDNINHRKELFLALESLGPECRSKPNYEEVRRLRDAELGTGYADVLAASVKAMKAMDPD